jgi:hypothetical protein
MKHTLLSLATLSLTSFVGAGVGIGSWLAITLDYETRKCQTPDIVKETPQN